MFSTISKPRTVVVRLATLAAAGILAFSAASIQAQTEPQAVIVNRITQPINPDVRVTLQHNVHPLAQARYDQGAAPGSMATGRIMLVLKRSDAQENALRQYLGDLQNPNSPNYRKWITPAQLGKQYGISDTDLTAVTAWLQSQGFTVDTIPQARNVIEFSGNVAQIQQAFNTSIHKYVINGETHFANSTDPQIPAALAPLVAGVAQLNDFRPKRGAVVSAKGHFDTDSKRMKPDLTLTCASAGCSFASSGGNVLFTDAADAATIYDTPNSALNPKYSGTTYDGSGVTIGIASDSNITPQDVALYRAAFLPSSYSSNQPKIIIDGNDPGVNGDAIEALLDLEVSGGIAPGANVNLYTSADTDLQAGLFLAIYRALNDNNVSILNVSFGLCEAAEGASGNAQILNAWEQAAAQGISVTVSTGDSGSAGCDDSTAVPAIASNGLAVSGLASTPYNIAVGGTDFDVLANSFSTYVSSSNAASSYYRTALSYIPESPWNDSPVSNNGGYTTNTPFKDSSGNMNISAGGGGISSTAVCSIALDQNGNCDGVLGPYSQPPFQTGVANSVSSSARALPDVSLLAADGAYGALWAICSDNVANGSATTQTDCEQTGGTFTSGTSITGVGGSSAAAPTFAGMLALISQSQGGARLGQANNVLYNLYANPAVNVANGPFHDVTTGNNSVVCVTTPTLSPDCGSNGFLKGYNAGAGYDAATGLGSVDVAQLIANWSKAVFTKTTTTLAISGGTNVQHGTALTLTATVGPSTASGDVSFINNSGLENNGALPGEFATLSNGTASLKTGDLPGGTYNLYAYYGGDVKNAASQSTNTVQVTITPESSKLAIGATMIDPLSGNTMCDDVTGSAGTCVGQSLPYGLATSLSGQVQGNSGSATVATGNIVFSDSGGSLPNSTVAISSNGLASYNNYVNQNQSFSVASHGLTATYSGDPSYSGSNSGSAYAFKVIQGQTQVVLTASQSGTTVTLQAQINTDSIGLAPTGTMTFKNGSTTLGTVMTSSATGFVTNANGQGSTVAALYQLQIPSSQITTAVKTARLDHSFSSWTLSGGAAAMACVLFLAIPARRRSWRALLGLIVFACMMSSVIACGGGSSNSGGGGGGGGGGTTSITAAYAGDANYSSSTSAAVTTITVATQ